MESPLKKLKQHRDTGRPYRSKRHPPCDQCRRKKLRCEADEGQSCQRCQSNSSPCSFTFSLHSSFLPNFGSVSDHQEVERGNGEKASPVTGVDQFQTMETPTCPESTINFDSNPINDPAGDFLLPLQPGYPLPERPTPQAIQTLDYLKGVSSQLIGASGESDPWLLRHCKFDEHGFLLFHQVHFRNAGGVPREEKIPVHFLVTGDELYDAAKETTRYPNIGSRRDELNSLVPLECGQRLVSLYVVGVHLRIFHCISVVCPHLFSLLVHRRYLTKPLADLSQLLEIHLSNSTHYIAVEVWNHTLTPNPRHNRLTKHTNTSSSGHLRISPTIYQI